MTTDTERERLVGKLLLDSQFRRRFVENPKEAANDLEIDLDDKEIAKFQDVDLEKRLDIVAQQLDQVISQRQIPHVNWRVDLPNRTSIALLKKI
ncbi:hypothetical protein HCG51_35275 (plasmid) [Tolypothrix sp. PCC 7910]|uniref:Os1348 family NHLP clan protein n=1 Tax=Tolypothrix sp. PCC 7910 TaxID=2099387 RepID=UPI0014278B75|nr:Os1348 family NHLP clan protein [Tolypothrix sp. PCC 7910]QIR41941.1 hypothetical protein HCG51_35275 [Tolypothrix sp. PCC 7910]